MSAAPEPDPASGGGALDQWTPDSVPDLTGRTAVVTGVTGGLGLHTVRELARRGARVLASARDSTRGQAVLDRVRGDLPDADVQLVVMDLADLGSVRGAAAAVVAEHPRIDIAINNAGLMAVPRSRTADGFELQMGTNHLGHFAWTGLLWPALVAADARVVAVSSIAHRSARSVPPGVLQPDDGSSTYRRWPAYAQSKLANLLCSVELDRRARSAGLAVTSLAAHPGLAATELVRSGPGSINRVAGHVMHAVSRLLSQSALRGAWPLIAAATAPGLPGGSYVGPAGLGETRGNPTLVGMSAAAQDPELARTVWELSERATGVSWP
jgi:NAD(P)-dependent dehydrogenase (short-subunit alcohol dehydrogenase family)